MNLFGEVAPRTNAHQKRNKAVADLKRLDATPATITRALAQWPRLFEGATLTDTALATHYPQMFAAAPKAKDLEVCAECESGGGRHVEGCSHAG